MSRARAGKSKTLPGKTKNRLRYWFDLLAKYSALITLVFLALGGGLRYFLVERPGLMRAEAEDSRALDGLLFDTVPKVQVGPRDGAIWDGNMVTLPFSIKNSGAMPVTVKSTVWWKTYTYLGGDVSLLPRSDQMTYKLCNEVIYLMPGESVACDAIIFADGATFDHTRSFEYSFTTNARTDLSPEMRTYQQLRSSYSEALISKNSNREMSATGYFTRPPGWRAPPP